MEENDEFKDYFYYYAMCTAGASSIVWYFSSG